MRKRAVLHCSLCLGRAARCDRSSGRRPRRHLDAGVLVAWIEAERPRVSCRTCGMRMAQILRARAAAGHTYEFDQQVAYPATTMNKAAVSYLMSIAWRAVGTIITG